jgi:hypothetical protein
MTMRSTTAILALSAGLLLAGCRWPFSAGGAAVEPPESRALERLRDVARSVAADPNIAMEKRVDAFEALRLSFPSGTPEDLIVRYLDPVSRSRLREGYNGFVLLVVGPDGREKWLTIVDGKLCNDPQKGQ